MGNTIYDEIPSLDLSDFLSGEDEKRINFVSALGDAFEDIGFVAVKNHGLSDGLMNNLYAATKRFFNLPEKIKLKYRIEGLHGQRGYTGKGEEHAKGQSTGDLKEFYHIGQNIDPEFPVNEIYPDNVWPEEVPAFKEHGIEAYKILENTGIYMLQAIAQYLGLDKNYFDLKVINGNSILRPIHYFPIINPEVIPIDAVRASEHGDINLITLLMGASAKGLQVKRNDGKWIAITALPDQIIVNVGDMMERLTNNKLHSTLHRVVNPPQNKMKDSRYSIPFFMHPKSEVDLNCLAQCIDPDHPKSYDDITVGEFLNERLKEIGLKTNKED